jgi:hypothetical protein
LEAVRKSIDGIIREKEDEMEDALIKQRARFVAMGAARNRVLLASPCDCETI